MISEPFDYTTPTTLDEARAKLAEVDGAKILAGGMSLIPAMKHRLARPPLLIDLRRVPGLGDIESRRGRVRIGARVTHASLSKDPLLEPHPIFREVAHVIGDRQVQARGTLGGSLVHADPAADWPAAFLALDGEATVASAGGERQIAADDFFLGMMTSALESDEILTSLSFTLETKRAGAAYLKVRHAASGFAVVGVAVQVTTDRKGRCDRVSIGITGVNPVPFRARSLEAQLAGQTLSSEVLREACGRIDEADPMEDPGASARYRARLLEVYAARTLERAYARSRGTTR